MAPSERIRTTQHPGASPVFCAVERHVLLGKSIVLLVEDDNDVRSVMESALGTIGYRVISCPDGEAALAAFSVYDPVDILVTDFETPRKTGIELAVELTELRPLLPVIVTTGSSLPTKAIEMIEERHWGYLRKPFNMATLRTTLERLMKTKTSAA